MDLAELASTYLQSLGYNTIKRGRDLLVGSRISLAEERHTILTWVPSLEPGQSFASQEGPYLSRFKSASEGYPRAQKFMLVPTIEGLSPGFRQKAKREYDINIRVPIQFFDTPYKWDEVSEAPSAARELSNRGKVWEKQRVPQPYTIISGTDIGKADDLLDVIIDRMKAYPRGSVNFVIGPAGIGKSVLFEVIFYRLYSTFIEHKRQSRVFPRPLPVLPEYIREATAPTLMSLVEGFLRTEFATPVTLGTFEWMVTNGFGIWLLDGLDELVARDPDFFNYLLELLTRPSSETPSIVLCLRDSLLSTNEGLSEFCEEFGQNINVYELSKWGARSKRIFVGLRLKRPLEADRFMSILRTRPEVDSLASVPYYCSLILDEYESGKLQDSYSEPGLVRNAVSSILEREYDKGLLDRDLIPPPSLLDLLQDLAFEDMLSNFQGLRKENVREYVEITLPTGLDRPILDKLIMDVVQLALFSRGTVTGNILFTQEILEHYLLGERLGRSLKSDIDLFLRDLSSRFIPVEWVTLKTVAERVRMEGNIVNLLDCLRRPAINPNAFRNILQICAYAVEDPTMLKNILFENRDISGVKFKGLDFRGVSFMGCNLTDVQFDECLLHDARLEAAIINNTGFWLKDKGDIRGACFGNMERLHSISIEPGKLYVDHKLIERWLREHTRVPMKILQPCDAAKQLRYLFGKYVHPNGLAKRAVLDRRGILSGKKICNAEETLQAAVRYGYLVEEQRYRDRIKRCEGDPYSEIVNYVVDLELSPGLRILLNDICSVENCQHIPSRRS